MLLRRYYDWGDENRQKSTKNSTGRGKTRTKSNLMYHPPNLLSKYRLMEYQCITLQTASKLHMMLYDGRTDIYIYEFFIFHFFYHFS